jgi:hypothetical protein
MIYPEQILLVVPVRHPYAKSFQHWKAGGSYGRLSANEHQRQLSNIIDLVWMKG